MGRNAWLSGTSSWTYQAATQYIIGVRAGLQGLVVDPCIPSSWKGFTVTRKFRGATYEITVKNPDGVCKGVREILLDGQPVAGNIVPCIPGDHKVIVQLG